MNPTRIIEGARVPMVERSPDAIDLFMFSASAWLPHRIHYDLPFTTEHDGHPALLIHGPIQGTYMIQSIQWWLGPQVRLQTITYRHSAPAYVGDTLQCGGTITNVTDEGLTADLWVQKSDGTTTTHGTATFGWTRNAKQSDGM